MPDLSKITQSDKGTEWAAAFKKQFGDNVVDEETMRCWFANAIETGKRFGAEGALDGNAALEIADLEIAVAAHKHSPVTAADGPEESFRKGARWAVTSWGPELSDLFGVVEVPQGLHKHTRELVLQFAGALALKLREAEKKYGYEDGWRDNDWLDVCRQKLREHTEKGDPRDVAAYCAFLWHHGESTRTPRDPAERAEQYCMCWHAIRDWDGKTHDQRCPEAPVAVAPVQEATCGFIVSYDQPDGIPCGLGKDDIAHVHSAYLRAKGVDDEHEPGPSCHPFTAQEGEK